ncbi:MAG: outer membrane protein transport protein [Bacteroidetes bacterium]|nr:outer membrane protein transport protein [Bacteroidota bacterium]MBU2585867.1 outer membrane protein transport protein [Bacteroidota bacterium]
MRTIKFLIFFFIITGTLSAQNFNDALRLSFPGLGVGARALGMGGAFTGISDDYSATYWNPAGLFQIKRMELNAGLNYNNLKNDASFFNNTTNFENSGTSLSNLGFVFPFPTIRGSMVFGLGYSRVNNFNEALAFSGFNPTNTSMIQSLLGKGDVSYLLYLTDSTGNTTPINGRLQQEGSILASGSENQWTLSGAIEVSKDLAVGVSINILGGSFERNRDYSEIDTKNYYGAGVKTDPADSRTADFQEFHFNETLKWELSGFSAKAGFMYRYKDMLRFGATIKFPSSFSIKEDYLVGGTAKFGTGFTPDISPALESNIEYEIITPYQFSAGISVTRSLFTVSGDINLTDYTQMEFKNLGASKTVQNNKDIKTLFKSIMDYSVGAEVKVLNSGLKLRGGYMVKNSPFKNDPSDFNRKYITLGAGFHADESFALDIAYIMGKWKTFGDNYGSDVSRTYQNIKTTDIIFTTTFRF